MKSLKFALLAVSAFAASPAFAQDALQPGPADQIVVVGALTDEELDREEIELTQANDLADLFRAVP